MDGMEGKKHLFFTKKLSHYSALDFWVYEITKLLKLARKKSCFFKEREYFKIILRRLFWYKFVKCSNVIEKGPFTY